MRDYTYWVGMAERILARPAVCVEGCVCGVCIRLCLWLRDVFVRCVLRVVFVRCVLGFVCAVCLRLRLCCMFRVVFRLCSHGWVSVVCSRLCVACLRYLLSEGSLRVQDVQLSDAGRYYCTVSNQAGSDHRGMDLRVFGDYHSR